jgi:hypothetical protein
MKVTEIFKYDPVVYPVELHAVFTSDLKPVAEKYVSLEGEELDVALGNGARASTYTVILEKETGVRAILVAFRSKGYASPPVFAHEAKHMADYIFRFIGEERLACEPHAYLLEWAVKCMTDAKNARPKDKDKHLSNGESGKQPQKSRTHRHSHWPPDAHLCTQKKV